MSDGQPVVNSIEQSPEFRAAAEKIYRPLDGSKNEFRLMHLAPAEDDDEPVSVRLEKASLDTQPSYEPISYTWEGAVGSATILVEQVPYRVTANQLSCLKRFRLRDNIRTMWMDAICINQADIDERAQQVSLMAEIFSSGHGTVIWLGEPDESWRGVADDRAIASYLNSMPAPVEEEIEFDQWEMTRPRHFAVDLARLKDEDWLAAALYALEILLSPPHFAELPFHILHRADVISHWYCALRTLTNVFNRPWWSRIWVVQEVSVSYSSDFMPSVHCGAQKFPFKMVTDINTKYLRHFSFNRCCSRWHGLHAGLNIGCYGAESLAGVVCDLAVMHRHFKTLSWRHVFEFTDPTRRQLQASDPHDYMYGLLGLLDGDGGIRIDYNVPLVKLYSKMMWTIILESDGLDSIPIATCFKQDGALPSWVIDFAAMPLLDRDTYNWSILRYTNVETRIITRPEIYHADLEEGILGVPGYELDTIGAVSAPFVTRINDDAGARKACMYWMRWLHEHGSPIISHQAFWELVFCACEVISHDRPDVLERLRGGERSDMSPSSLSGLPHWEDWIRADNDAPLSDGLREIINMLHRGRCLYTTRKGHYGIAGPAVRTGDKLFRLRALPKIVVLRPVFVESQREREPEQHESRKIGSFLTGLGGAFKRRGAKPHTTNERQISIKSYKVKSNCYLSNFWETYYEQDWSFGPVLLS